MVVAKNLFFALLLLCAAQGWGAITLSTHTVFTDNAGNSNSITTPALTTTGANLMVAGCTYLNSGTFTSVTDSKSNSYTCLTPTTSNGNEITRLCYATNPTVGTSHTVTFNGTGIFGSIAVAAFSGVTTSSPLDQQNKNQTANATTLQPGSVTPGQANEVLVTVLGYKTAGFPISIDGSYTITDSAEFTANNYGISLAYLVQTSPAASNPTWTRGAGNDDVSAQIATFIPAPSGYIPPTGFFQLK